MLTLVVGCPTFVLMGQEARGADWLFYSTVRGKSFSGRLELPGF